MQWWLSDAYLEAGHLRDAESVFSSYGWNQWYTPFSREPLAQQRLGRIYEELGRVEEALSAYAYFLEDWEDAEPPLRATGGGFAQAGAGAATRGQVTM